MYAVMRKLMTSIQIAFTTGLTFKWLFSSINMTFCIPCSTVFGTFSFTFCVFALFTMFSFFQWCTKDIKFGHILICQCQWTRAVIVCKFNHTETSGVMNATSLRILTPCSRVLEKLTGSQLVKKFPAFHGTQRFITAYTSSRHFIYLSEMKCTVLNVWIKEIC
jgi:hypothetical protein